MIGVAADRSSLGRRVAARLAASAGADAAFLAGSTVAGLGSPSSDIDVYLIGAGLPAARRQLVVQNVRVDVQCLAAEALAEVVDRVAGRAGSDPAGPTVSDKDVVLAVRLWTGEVVTGAGVLAAARERLAVDPLVLRRLVVNGWALAAYTAVEDLAGLWGSGDQLDLDMAVLAARRALIAAGKAVAAGCGDLYHGEKWVSRQLARSAPDTFPLLEFRRLLRGGPLTDRPWDELAALVSLAQTCLAAAMTLGWYGVPMDRWPDWRPQQGPLWRARCYLPQRYGEGMSIVGPGTSVYPVPPEAALVWGLCNGSPAGGVAAGAAALAGLAEPFARLAGRRCHAIIGKLVDAGLVIDADSGGEP